MSKRILVIDDDDDDREMILEVVAELDPSITHHTAFNGANGLEVLTSLETLPVLIFLDLNMPIMSGTDFLRKVKGIDRLKGIPVVILSTSADSWAVEEAKALGAMDFVTKPDRFKDWRTILNRFIV